MLTKIMNKIIVLSRNGVLMTKEIIKNITYLYSESAGKKSENPDGLSITTDKRSITLLLGYGTVFEGDIDLMHDKEVDEIVILCEDGGFPIELNERPFSSDATNILFLNNKELVRRIDVIGNTDMVIQSEECEERNWDDYINVELDDDQIHIGLSSYDDYDNPTFSELWLDKDEAKSFAEYLLQMSNLIE